MRAMKFWMIAAAALLGAAGPVEDADVLIEQERYEEAFDVIAPAAAAGDLKAMRYLAWFYDNGHHVEKDQARAYALYRRVAENGDRHAQWRIGVMLDLGEGVRVNPAEAFTWLRRSAEQGFARAHVSLGVMYAMGRGVRQDFARSLDHYKAGAKLGSAHGFYGVAVLHRRGEGVPADQVESLAWMLAAAALEDSDAQEAVEGYGLSADETARAAARGNEILREFGYGNAMIEFENSTGVPSAEA